MTTDTPRAGYVDMPTRTVTHRLFDGLAMGPPSGRLILVEVYRDDKGRHSVHWQPVAGLLTAVVSEYQQKIRIGDRSCVAYDGRNHGELLERGWQLNGTSLEVYPVVAGEGDMEPPLYAVGTQESLEAGNMVHRIVVPCDWPPDQDRDNAIRVGRGLLEGKMIGQDRWANLD